MPQSLAWARWTRPSRMHPSSNKSSCRRPTTCCERSRRSPRTERLPIVQQHSRTFSCLADFIDIGALRIVGGHPVEHEIAVPDHDSNQILHVVCELTIAGQWINLSSISYVRSTDLREEVR